METLVIISNIFCFVALSFMMWFVYKDLKAFIKDDNIPFID